MSNHVPKGSMCAACQHRGQNCAHLPFHEMPVMNRLPDGAAVVKCSEFVRRDN